MKDIEIAKKAKIEKISEIAKKIDISEDKLEYYGKDKAKINIDDINEKKEEGKLILVTAINPTPLGEGKTTVSIGLADALHKIGKKTILTLREPSLGPVFGIKGGATGGGYSQVLPMVDINLHFTGDIHAITSANNLLSAIIDNHIYHGNILNIKRVTWKRCVDLNDRQLRVVNTGLSNEKNIVPREDGFDISVASEIMAILCLSKDRKDLKNRLGRIVIGYDNNEKPITAKDLKADGAMAVLLKDAIKPNLVQTLEHTPTFIHGGPFANIAHGCNSVIATKLALNLSEYCVTEAGFGADLGAEKFLDIKTRILEKTPDTVVIVATLKALKYHGGATKENAINENEQALKCGIHNLMKHIENITEKFNIPAVVAINLYTQDSEKEINILQEELNKNNVQMSLVECWEKGSEGSIDLAQKVIKSCENKKEFKYIYNLNDSIEQKITAVATKIYGAKNVEFAKEAKEQIQKIESIGYGKLPICIAKTQYSLSDDAKNLQCLEPFNIHVKDVQLKAGAGFIVIITGKIMTMPGLPIHPAAEEIDITDNNEVIGIF